MCLESPSHFVVSQGSGPRLEPAHTPHAAEEREEMGCHLHISVDRGLTSPLRCHLPIPRSTARWVRTSLALKSRKGPQPSGPPYSGDAICGYGQQGVLQDR